MAGRRKHEKCGAVKRDGSVCIRPVLVEGEHCESHGGSTRAQKKSTEVARARKVATAMGLPVDIDPFTAIGKAMAIANGEVDYYTRRIEEIDPDLTFIRPTSILHRPLNEGKDGEDPGIVVEEVTEGPEELNPLIRARNQAADRLAKFSKMALDANIDERLAKLEEAYAGQIVHAVRGILEAHGITEIQTPVVERYLTTIDSTAVEI